MDGFGNIEINPLFGQTWLHHWTCLQLNQNWFLTFWNSDLQLPAETLVTFRFVHWFLPITLLPCLYISDVCYVDWVFIKCRFKGCISLRIIIIIFLITIIIFIFLIIIIIKCLICGVLIYTGEAVVAGYHCRCQIPFHWHPCPTDTYQKTFSQISTSLSWITLPILSALSLKS